MDPITVLEALRYSRKCLEQMNEGTLESLNEVSGDIFLEILKIKRTELVLAPKSRGHNCPHCGGTLLIEVR